MFNRRKVLGERERAKRTCFRRSLSPLPEVQANRFTKARSLALHRAKVHLGAFVYTHGESALQAVDRLDSDSHKPVAAL
jgi:hypothetical protein